MTPSGRDIATARDLVPMGRGFDEDVVARRIAQALATARAEGVARGRGGGLEEARSLIASLKTRSLARKWLLTNRIGKLTPKPTEKTE